MHRHSDACRSQEEQHKARPKAKKKAEKWERHRHDGRLKGVAANCPCFCRGSVGSYLDVDLTTAGTGTSEFLNSKAGEILSTSPHHTPNFFVHAVGYRPHTALTCLPGKFMHPHRMDDRGTC